MNVICREKEVKKVEHMIEVGELKKSKEQFSVWTKVTYMKVPFVTTEAIISNANPFKIESKTLIWMSSYFIHDIIINSIDYLIRHNPRIAAPAMGGGERAPIGKRFSGT